jgi:branched-chain amino acid transport system substrate-binding protein
MFRRSFIAGGAGLVTSFAITGRARAAETPGVTATEIKIGCTMPFSGPASSYSNIGRGDMAFFKMVNDRGGVGGRKINFIALDDGYSPPRTVEQIRKLVEEDQVAFTFNTLGTPTNTAVEKYLNHKKVPQLFVATGADKWGNYKQYPWTIGWQPSYRTESQIYAKHILAKKPDAKIAILFQNDDFGKDYVLGVKDSLGDKFDKMVIKQASYETSDPTIDSQVVELQSSGADTLIVAAIPKFAAQAIRKVYDIGWKPLFFMTNVSVSVAQVIKPAGAEKAVGIISAEYLKDPTDPAWNDDAGMKEWRAFMAKYLPDGDTTDANFVYSYGASQTMLQVLKQCGEDFSRENIMKQAANLHDVELAALLPGIRINTSPTNYHPIRQEQLARWNGKIWERFGEVIEGSGA